MAISDPSSAPSLDVPRSQHIRPKSPGPTTYHLAQERKNWLEAAVCYFLYT